MSRLQLVKKQESSSSKFDSDSPFELRGLTASYGEKPAIFSIDFKAPANSLVAIVGPNGAGKSTLIKSALGIVPRLSGMVCVHGKDFEDQRLDVAYVPQRASVDWDFPARVIDVVMMGLYHKIGFLNFARRHHKNKAMECLERVSMAEFYDRQVGQLSGGQQQRVFLARALAQEAKLYLLDEPFAGVDAATERTIIDVLKDLKKQDCTVICVHHDLSTVRSYFDYMLMINIRKIAEGPVNETFTAENLQSTYGGRLATNHIDELNLTDSL